MSDGVPLQLDWHTNDSETFDIDTYEEIASDKQVRRLSAVERAVIAGANSSKSFLEKVQEEVQLIQVSRAVSIKEIIKLGSSQPSIRKNPETVSPSFPTTRGFEYANWF